MKKTIFLFSVTALALVSCVKTQDAYVGAPETRQIVLRPLAQPVTKAAISGTVFTPDSMKVAAWDVTHSADFFTETKFVKGENQTTWKGGKYWPLSPVTINFLAYAELTGEATWDISNDETSQQANGVVLAMTDNSTAQKDLMYAIGTGSVEQPDNGNALTFPGNIGMAFKHAQAWVSFKADAYDDASGGKITLNSITLNGAKYSGTFTVTHTNYNASTGQSVAGAWDPSSLGLAKDVAVPGWTAAAVAYDGQGGVAVGDGLLIVPDDDNTQGDFTSFTINYSLGGHAYEYTYTPTSTNVEQAKHYIFNICFHLHEIEIAASVENWTSTASTAVPVG